MAAVAKQGKGRVWRVPRDGKEFVGCLVGGYKDTRENMKREFLTRYGIRIVSHFGLEKRKDPDLYVPLGTEICVILTDDVEKMLPRVLKAALKANVPTIGIERKPGAWDTIFSAEGFANPPRFRDGFDVDKLDQALAMANKIDIGKMEEERLLEIKAIDDKPRLAYEDPALRDARLGKLADAFAAVEKAPSPPPPKIAAPVGHHGGTLKPGQTVPAGEGFGQILRSAREAMGWTQGKLAKKIGRAQGNLSSWERGASIPLYEAWMDMKKHLPDLPEPEGMQGKHTYDLRHKDDTQAAVKLIEKTAPRAVKLPPIEMPPGPGKTLTTLAVQPSITVQAHEQATLPYTPVVHVQRPSAPVIQKATPHVTSQLLTGSPLDEYMAVLQELKAFDESIKPRREEILARADALHKRVTGR